MGQIPPVVRWGSSPKLSWPNPAIPGVPWIDVPIKGSPPTHRINLLHEPQFWFLRVPTHSFQFRHMCCLSNLKKGCCNCVGSSVFLIECSRGPYDEEDEQRGKDRKRSTNAPVRGVQSVLT